MAEMTSTELVTHVRTKLATAGLYPWWMGLREKDIVDLCERLEAKDTELASAARRIACQSEILQQHAEALQPKWWPEVKRKCGILLGEALGEATCYFAEPLLILQLTFPIDRLDAREYCREREPLLRAVLAQEAKQVWSIRWV